MNYRILILVVLFALCFRFLNAQKKSDSLSYILKEVEVKANRLTLNKKADLQLIKLNEDEANESNNLAELINNTTNLNLKSYGMPGITQASTRGASSAHSPIVLNGFNIQDPLNGVVNLSLIPSFFIDEAFIQSGGSSAIFGSGAIGGSVHLNNSLKFNEGFGLRFYSSNSSINNFQNGLALKFSNKKLSTSAKMFFKNDKNNFRYRNNYKINSPIELQKNSELKDFGFLLSNSFFVSKNQYINSNFWLLTNNRNIPAKLSESNSFQHQIDNSLRHTIDYKLYTQKAKYILRNAVFFKSLNYEKTDINLNAIHKSFTHIIEAEAFYNFRKFDELNFGINHKFVEAKSNSLSDNSNIKSLSIFGQYIFSINKKLKFKSAIRNEIRDTEIKQPTFEIMPEFTHKSFVYWYSFSSNYRMPTLNDLYWRDAYSIGNQDLKDEKSFNNEIGICKNTKLKNSELNTSFVFYQMNTENLILWILLDGLWTPVNKSKVLSKGMDFKLNYKKKISDFKLELQALYSYNQAINANEDSESYGNIIIFTPKHSANFVYKMNYKNFGLKYSQNYVGKRFLTEDNKTVLQAYFPANISISYKHLMKKSKLIYQIDLINIFEHEYVVMPAYPMPLRYFSFNIKYIFN